MAPNKITLCDLTRAQLQTLVTLTSEPEQPALWNSLSQGDLSEQDKRSLSEVLSHLRRTQRFNEATVFARAIYPLLRLAEQGEVVAFCQVPLGARIGETELSGVADGALALSDLDEPSAPLIVVVEAKRAAEAKDPLLQLLGALLCAAFLNAEAGHPAPSSGCYTISDVWTFARCTLGPVTNVGKIRMSVTLSRQYIESVPTDALAIVRILQSLVAQALVPAAEATPAMPPSH